jgi:hypothetical protein
MFYHLFSIFLKKISSAISIRGIIDHLHGNNPFLELEQSCVPNSTTCSTNSTAELLYGGVRGAELEKRQRSSPKHPHRLQNMDSSSVGVALRCATLLRQNTTSIP